MNLLEREARRNNKIYALGLIGLPVILGLLLGMWWVMVLQYELNPYFFTAVSVSVIITYCFAWILRGKTTNSIGLQIHTMTKAEAMVHLAVIIDHIKDTYSTEIDYQVRQIEDKRTR